MFTPLHLLATTMACWLKRTKDVFNQESCPVKEGKSQMKCGICRRSKLYRIVANSTFNVGFIQCFNYDFIQTEHVSTATLSDYYSTDYRINGQRERSTICALNPVIKRRPRSPIIETALLSALYFVTAMTSIKQFLNRLYGNLGSNF